MIEQYKYRKSINTFSSFLNLLFKSLFFSDFNLLISMKFSKNVNSTFLMETKFPKLSSNFKINHELPKKDSSFFDS